LPRLDLTGGLRYTYEDKSGSYNQYQSGGVNVNALPPGVGGLVTAIRAGVFGFPVPDYYYKNLTHNAALSYLASATYNFTDDLLAYASYSRGNKSSGTNVTLLPAVLVDGKPDFLVSPIVKPERVDSYEVGIKSSWFNNRLVANLAGFWIEDSDYQGLTASVVPDSNPPAFTSYIASVPKVRSQGFELDSHARPWDWLTLNFSGAYTYAVYESYPQGQCPIEVSGSATKICNLSGETVPGTSRWVMSAGGEITQKLGSLGRYDIIGYAGADFSLRSSFNVDVSDSIYSKIPGYGLLDVRLGARTADSKYDLFLWSHNATNTDYYLIKGTSVPFTGLLNGNIGDPVTFGATFRVRL
jgi:iron complex outermembrane receptor protein